MKKLILGTFLAAAMCGAMATDVGVSSVTDTNVNKSGVRVTMVGPQVLDKATQLAVTSVDDSYIRYSVGVDHSVLKHGPIDVSLTGAGVYQDTIGGVNGYALTLGTKVTYTLTKSVDLVGSVERFVGQERVSDKNGNVVAMGLVAKF
jgi:hypothetical protein